VNDVEKADTVPDASGRLASGARADIDVYRLESGDFLLFAHLKQETADGGEAFLREAVQRVPGSAIVIGRALKTPDRSEPLAPLWLVPERQGTPLVAVERGLRYALEVEQVLNPGLFLDQERNRARLTELVRAAGVADAALLNLFSYTGSFSVAARAGGISQTTSVDVSARYLAWERRNWETNFGEGAAPRLIKDDARDFVRRASKKETRYRFIVVDPPTFSRGQGKAFRVRGELVPLVEGALACFPDDGPAALLASTNDAGFFEPEFNAELEQLARRKGLRFERGIVPEGFRDTHAKSAWLLRDL